MAVQHIRPARLTMQPTQMIIDEAIQMLPERFLEDMTFRADLDPNDLRVFSQCLNGFGVIVANFAGNDAPRDQIHSLDIRLFCQGFGQFHDIFGSRAGFGVASQFQIVDTNQTVDADQDDDWLMGF